MANSHIPQCPRCGEDGVRDVEHDAYYCRGCDEWLEPGCNDIDCEFCVGRPDRPSEANERRKRGLGRVFHRTV